MGFNFKSGNLLRPDLWTTGSGSFAEFNQNGETSENERVIGTNPWGKSAVVWETRPIGTNDADGGWNTNAFTIDKTQLYRFSVWIKRTSDTTSGTFYFGINPCVIRNDNSTEECNPYWHCTNIGAFTKDQWYLVVGHCFPYTYAGARHANSGLYVTTGKISSTLSCNAGSEDVRWKSDSTYGVHRTYHYYCTDTTSHLQFYKPRIDLCDGTEPTMTELLSGTALDTGINLLSTTITPEGAAFKNQLVVATGGDAITYNGQWKIHRFNASGNFVLTSFIGSTLTIDYLVVGGGGGGGTNMGGGGGGGGVISGSTTLTVGSYSIVVGGGGSGAPAGIGTHPTTRGTVGSNSTFNGLTAYGGGYGGLSPNSYGYQTGGNGGCGGGASGYNDNGAAAGQYYGTGTAGQGFNGGAQGNAYYAGGGGGAGAAGVSGNSKPDGGAGKYSNILGRPFYWGGGGGGSSYSAYGGGNGGIGGGGGGAGGFPSGNGGQQAINWGVYGLGTCTNCQDNKPGGNGGQYSGGGGGAGSHYNYTNAGGAGGSGIVVIRYKYK